MVTFVAALMAILLSAVVFGFGLYFGRVGTIQFLKMNGELPESWPTYESAELTTAECEHCNDNTNLFKCSVKGTKYDLCENCMGILGANPTYE